jgi:ABC-type transporter Mla MlaB component
MLRITVQENQNQVTIKLEGSLAGAWVMELEEVWRATRTTVVGRTVCIDLAAVSNVDRAGTYLLVLLRDRGARLIASGLVMTGIADMLREWPLARES